MTKLQNALREKQIPFLISESLKKHTTFKIGGNAKVFIEPSSPKEIGETVRLLKDLDIPFLILGKGSNILFSDKGYNGAILHIGSNMAHIELVSEDTIYAQSGAKLSEMCMFALEQGLEGMEALYGIPGSVGGAAYMNAGAYGGETKDMAVSSTYVDLEGNEGSFSIAKMDLSYRHSIYCDNGYIITGLTVKLKKGDREEIRRKMDDYLNRRTTKQPLEYPSGGSTFKRPVDNYASALIDQCGLKGLTVGDAQVSEKHAGFIINRGSASSDDIVALIEKVKTEVMLQKNVQLECEIMLIGF